MANKIIKVCDKCKKETTYTDDLKARGAGWTVLNMNFGETANGFRNAEIIMDLCPECSEKMHMIKTKEYNGNPYIERVDKYNKSEQNVDTNDILENIKDFIREIGEEEGWYSE